MGFKIQRLRRRVGRVTSKSSKVTAGPYADAGFPAAPGSDSENKAADEGIEDPRRYMQLHNTIIRALLVVPVTYEPSKLLRRSKDAVLIITGADLVLVKMGRAATAGSIGPNTNSHAAGGNASETGTPAADGQGGSGSATADANQATVLAQHELNKMVKCHATGTRLELEFIVTGNARFKVSAAALGFSNSMLEPAGSRNRSQGSKADSMPYDEAVNAAMHQSQQNSRSRLSQQSRQAEGQQRDTEQQPGRSAAAAVPADGVHAASRGSSSSHIEVETLRSVGAAAAATAAAATAADLYTSRLELSSSPGRFEPAGSSNANKAAPSAVGRASAPGNLGLGCREPTVSAASSPDRLQRTEDSKKLVQWSAERRMDSVGGAPIRTSSGGTHTRTGSGSASTAGFSRAHSQNMGTETADLAPAALAEDASKSISSSISSLKLVKTDEGDYWVCVESFTLHFRDALMCQMAAELLQSGRASMRMAVDWLKQGLPFRPGFAVTHITEMCSSRTGAETLVSGPICWDTDLQLPDSWVRAINSSDLPQEQPLLTRLEVAEGPAAFKVHLATPAGLAEASLLPEFLAVLARSQQPWGQLLAVPVKLASEQPPAGQPLQQDSQQQRQTSAPGQRLGQSVTDYPTQHKTTAADSPLLVPAGPAEQQQQQEPGLRRIGERGQLYTLHGDDSAGDSEDGYSTDSHDQQDGSRYQPLSGHHEGSESRSSSRSSVGQVDSQREPGLSSAAGSSGLQGPRGGAPGQDAAVSRSSRGSSTIKRLVTMPSRSYASAKGAAKGLLQRVVTHRDPSHRGGSPSILSKMGPPVKAHPAFYVSSDSGGPQKLGLRRRGSADRFRRSKSQPEGLATFSAAGSDVASEPGPCAASQADSDADSDSGTAHLGGFKGRFGSSGDLVGLQHKSLGGAGVRHTRLVQQDRQLSHRSWGGASSGSGASGSNQQGFLGQQGQTVLPNEVYAVLHVRLLLSGTDDTPCAAVRSITAAAGSASPFAAAAALGTAPLADSGEHAEQGTKLPASPSIVMLGSVQQRAGRQMTTQEQQLLSAAGCLAAVLCVIALLFRQTAAGPLLILLAAVVNLSCMVLSARPGWVRSASRQVLRLLRRGQGLLLRCASKQRISTSGASSQPAPSRGLLSPRPSLLAAADSSTKPPPVPADTSQAAGNGLRLRLLGASFVKEPLGLLQEQISAFKGLQDQALIAAGEAVPLDAASVPGTLQDLVHEAHTAAAADESDSIVLVSRPEPAWMTPDWRTRILQARQSSEERLKLASYVHTWRVQYAAHKLLKQHPPNFAWFQKQLYLKPLVVTPQGHLVLLLKMASLVQTSRNLAAAGLTAADMTAYCGFIWSFMFEVLATGAWPSGRLILVSDMKDLKLGQAVGEGQVGGRALGAVCGAWPERLVRCLVLGAPSWFNMLYRLVRPHLSPSTSAKIQVCDSAGAAAELAQYLEPDMVPREYGGPCTMLHDEYPAQKQLLEFVAGLS